MAVKTQVKCPKCSGHGTITAFGHVADGVCFMCEGAKFISVDLMAKRSKLHVETVKKADWVMASTADSYAKLSFEKLLKIRNFCHMGWGLQEAYPQILSHFREVGEPAFQVAQNEKWNEMHSRGL